MPAPISDDPNRSLESIENAHILRVLEECGYNQTRTAQILGIDRVTLHNKLKKLGWSRPVTV
jgi:DNA-binding NtrC family response regulator